MNFVTEIDNGLIYENIYTIDLNNRGPFFQSQMIIKNPVPIKKGERGNRQDKKQIKTNENNLHIHH
jgi:hypothetical protein